MYMKKYILPIRNCADCINRTIIFDYINKTIQPTYRCNLFQYKCIKTNEWKKEYIYNCRKDENKCGLHGRHFITKEEMEKLSIIHDKFGNVLKLYRNNNSNNSNNDNKPIIDI